MSAVFEIIKDRCNYNSNRAEDIYTIKNRVISRGFSEEQFEVTLRNYELLDVIMVEDKMVHLMNPTYKD